MPRWKCTYWPGSAGMPLDWHKRLSKEAIDAMAVTHYHEAPSRTAAIIISGDLHSHTSDGALVAMEPEPDDELITNDKVDQ